ncbi:Gfo/Idh/MocA family protein [Robertkochia solimangrovi]|uniref:Gfo/Idh/MocA family protein n=1 Tax=Robertkochia solimangrovi TaxID=2213046 RepID=UPI00117F3693|nr:Gfo/Idh/MocA family oxidoreductase [Robertkochia solimangrovi]TRZ43476.1 gfo/Idh/MocA family oxidoreductase [Robertkochia solimangrovi]
MSSTDKAINWGIVGPGNIARKFTTDLIRTEQGRLYGVASRSIHKAEEFALEFGAQKTFDSYESLFSDPAVDAVYIALPHSFHCDITISALNHGKAVLCEKPLALDSDQVAKMFSAALKNDVLLMEALWTRFLPHFSYLMELHKKEIYGKPLRLEADFGFVADLNPESRLLDKSLGGGSLLDIGIYPVFAAQTLLGIPDNITAKATFFNTGADSGCAIEFDYQKGCKAKLLSTLLRETPTRLKIIYEKAVIETNQDFFRPSDLTITTESEKKTITFDRSHLGFKYEIDHFNTLLLTGKTNSDLFGKNESIALMNTLDTIKRMIGLSYKKNV